VASLRSLEGAALQLAAAPAVLQARQAAAPWVLQELQVAAEAEPQQQPLKEKAAVVQALPDLQALVPPAAGKGHGLVQHFPTPVANAASQEDHVMAQAGGQAGLGRYSPIHARPQGPPRPRMHSGTLFQQEQAAKM